MPCLFRFIAEGVPGMTAGLAYNSCVFSKGSPEDMLLLETVQFKVRSSRADVAARENALNCPMLL